MSVDTLREELKRRLLDGDFTCEKELTLSLISGKRKVVVIWHLSHEGPLRFGELSRLFKTSSHRILTKQLRELEMDGLITRQIFEGAVPKVEYRLTELGESIVPIVDMMWEWGKTNMFYYANKIRQGAAKDTHDSGHGAAGAGAAKVSEPAKAPPMPYAPQPIRTVQKP
ncbi:MAG: helix-turn-helix transcriptional regulator [Clostridiales Family XIII bacterium]|jgi:DNA-binding HxlR family transcriptional regulator|nr:helix-turn-helix transcriptional regulator [Clostridiales Family XIII bacterium]